MNNTAFVYTKEELKKAIDNDTQTIHVMSKELAESITTVKNTSKLALGAAIASVGVAATNFWNPVGWGAAALSVTVSSTVLIAIAVIGGAVLVWAIYNNYTIRAKRKVTKPDGTVEESEMTLERN